MRARAHTVVLLSCCHKCHTSTVSTLKVNHLCLFLTSSHVSLIHKTQTTGHFPQNNRSLSTKRRLVFIKTRDIFIKTSDISGKTSDISCKTRLIPFFQCRQKATATDFVASCCDTCDSKKHKISMIRARAYREKEGISIFSIPY